MFSAKQLRQREYEFKGLTGHSLLLALSSIRFGPMWVSKNKEKLVAQQDGVFLQLISQYLV